MMGIMNMVLIRNVVEFIINWGISRIFAIPFCGV